MALEYLGVPEGQLMNPDGTPTRPFHSWMDNIKRRVEGLDSGTTTTTTEIDPLQNIIWNNEFRARYRNRTVTQIALSDEDRFAKQMLCLAGGGSASPGVTVTIRDFPEGDDNIPHNPKHYAEFQWNADPISAEGRGDPFTSLYYSVFAARYEDISFAEGEKAVLQMWLRTNQAGLVVIPYWSQQYAATPPSGLSPGDGQIMEVNQILQEVLVGADEDNRWSLQTGWTFHSFVFDVPPTSGTPGNSQNLSVGFGAYHTSIDGLTRIDIAMPAAFAGETPEPNLRPYPYHIPYLFGTTVQQVFGFSLMGHVVSTTQIRVVASFRNMMHEASPGTPTLLDGTPTFIINGSEVTGSSSSVVDFGTRRNEGYVVIDGFSGLTVGHPVLGGQPSILEYKND